MSIRSKQDALDALETWFDQVESWLDEDACTCIGCGAQARIANREWYVKHLEWCPRKRAEHALAYILRRARGLTEKSPASGEVAKV